MVFCTIKWIYATYKLHTTIKVQPTILLNFTVNVFFTADPRVGLSCLGKVNVEYENDPDVMIQFYKFIAR